MPRRWTKKTTYVRLPEQRIRQIQELVASWPYETKAFMRARLNQYKPPAGWINGLIEWGLSFFMEPPDKSFRTLSDPTILTDWQKRSKLSGQSNPQAAWHRILEKEVSARDYHYLLSLLNEGLMDVHVPVELEKLFDQIYRSHIRKEYAGDSKVPKAPLVLIVGPSGSGKTSTVTETIEKVIFNDQVLPEVDLLRKKEEVLADLPFWKTLDEVDPELAMEIDRHRHLKFYKALAAIPVVDWIFKRRINRHLAMLEEQGMVIDYAMVTPNDYQTALAGEPGNYFKKAMGNPKKTTIRHIEEAQSAFGRVESHAGGAERQQRSLIDTANIVLDEIVSGKRDCLLIATTDQPERFDQAIYRRFVEKGTIINISEYWKNPVNLREVVRLELQRHDIVITASTPEAPDNKEVLSPVDLDQAVAHIFKVFRERSLKVIPSYVRKLVHSIVEIKDGFCTSFLNDPLLVRRAFELVAQNAYGDLYQKIVDRMDRDVKWEEYVGGIKDLFSEMANNCLYYSVDEEKGVVLNGPPGGGKTFLVRTWLGENKDVHDIATSATALQDPANPYDGAAENMEKLYDIAKMIAPTVVFFDEGDALAPRRSETGGSPSDKLTNKFLSLIDGEVPLNRVFTVLTTNRLDIIDPALIRSKRLKVMEVSGAMSAEDISAIVAVVLKDVPLTTDLSIERIIQTAQGLCNTPADYAAFVEKAKSLRSTEYEVLQRYREMTGADEEIRTNFVKFNLKTLLGIVEAVDLPAAVRNGIKSKPLRILEHHDEVQAGCNAIESAEQYPLTVSHIVSAKMEISQSPVQKGKVQLDEFLEAELSQEPQVGFIIGVGANDISGVLLPIATSLTYRTSHQKVLVTGAVSSPSSAGAQMDMAVQMTQQSAQEALTMVKNYLQGLNPKVSTTRLLGEFLESYTLHHQLLSASYNVGGPSAGYALAINTLSALLHIPVYNDFGITGAPWTKGVKIGEVGGSVIIGGHKKKTEKVLAYLRRMYMPEKNYMDLEKNFLVNYWSNNKDVIGVTHFGDLIPEVVWLDEDYGRRLEEMIALRIHYKLSAYKEDAPSKQTLDRIQSVRAQLRSEVEQLICDRLDALRAYLRSPDRDPHLSLTEIYRRKPVDKPVRQASFVNMMRHIRTKGKTP